MTLTTEEQDLFDELRNILAERLVFNRTWENVRLKIKKTYFEIVWFGHQEYDDPRGAIYEERKRIAPLNISRLKEVVARQRKNLNRDRRVG